AVVIAFIICYAPLHIQRLITSRLNPAHLSLVQQRAITIFYFISGLFYYIGSTVNPIFYHLFSRKYRLAFNRTMKKILHCKRRRQKQNLERAKKLSLLRHHPNTTSRLRRKPTAPIYRPSNRLNINSDRRKLLRISSSPYAQERMH
ncbi:unnamed protein product, partial [Rotaria magnacalcarata]